MSNTKKNDVVLIDEGNVVETRNKRSVLGKIPRAIIASVVLLGFVVGMVAVLETQEFINIFGSTDDDDQEQARVDTEPFRATVLTNLDSVQAAVGFTNLDSTPYPDDNSDYNVDIDVSQNCWIIFSNESKIDYQLVTSVENPDPDNDLVYMTHERPCGVCSSLQDLAVYLDSPDLTGPVRSCGISFTVETHKQCLLDIGFSTACSEIWRYNTLYTRDNCQSICLSHFLLNQPNNVPSGSGDNFCDPNDANEPCGNKINNGPACDAFQYEEGEFRLHPCLQCDECLSGGFFQKIAGRTRRNSGISSGIRRPNTVEGLLHEYFVSEDE